MNFIDNDDAPKNLLKQLKYELKRNKLDCVADIYMDDVENVKIGDFEFKTALYTLLPKDSDINHLVGSARVIFVEDKFEKIFDYIYHIFSQHSSDLATYPYNLLKDCMDEIEIEIIDELYACETTVYFCVNSNNINIFSYLLLLKDSPYGLLSFSSKKSFKNQKALIIRRAELMPDIVEFYSTPDGLSKMNKEHLTLPISLYIDPFEFSYNFNIKDYMKILYSYIYTLEDMHILFENNINNLLKISPVDSYYSNTIGVWDDNVGISEYNLNGCRFNLITYGENAYFNTEDNGYEGFRALKPNWQIINSYHPNSVSYEDLPKKGEKK